MAAGTLANQPVLWGQGESDLTSEEYKNFVKPILRPPTNSQNPDQADAYIVKGAKMKHITVPKTGYGLGDKSAMAAFTLERFKESIYVKGSPPKFLGLTIGKKIGIDNKKGGNEDLEFNADARAQSKDDVFSKTC